MKRIICLLLTVCALALAGCGSAPPAGSTGKSKPVFNELKDKGTELICKVDELAECEEYTKLYTASAEVSDIINGIGADDYDSPQSVFIIEDLDKTVLDIMAPEINLPDKIAKMLRGRFVSALPSQITAMNGVSSIAATSILSYGESFIYDGISSPVVYLYTYVNGYSFMVSFIPNDENIVTANVSCVINDELSKCASVEDVMGFFRSALNYEDVSVSAATEEKYNIPHYYLFAEGGPASF